MRRIGTGILLGAVIFAAAPAVQAAPNPVLEPVSAVTTTPPTPAGVRQAVRRVINQSGIGRISASVVDAATGDVLLDVKSDRAQIPASTMKVATAAAALKVLGPNTRLRTTVVRSGNVVTIVGGGDATLVRAGGGDPRAGGAASLKELAAQTAQALAGTDRVRLRYDTSAFTGGKLGPGWSKALVTSGNVAPVSALMVNEGRTSRTARSRVPDPAKAAANTFAALLRAQGVQVQSVKAGAAPADATQIAVVESAPVRYLVERILTDSSNDLAESLAHLVGGAAVGDPSFRGGARATTDVLRSLGVPMDGVVIADGSGLSAKNRMSPQTLSALLRLVASRQDPSLSVIGSGLAVAGVSGTLADRFTTAPTKQGAGYVRAKTGTLTGVVALSGIVNDRDGRILIFTIMANGVPSIPTARNAIDRFATQLALCGCTK
jgi:D-alanyl-D-alanine carboxypeptidase/D-alanyl-D-alanine-endopeptidase (penicillin-binding protein 4)